MKAQAHQWERKVYGAKRFVRCRRCRHFKLRPPAVNAPCFGAHGPPPAVLNTGYQALGARPMSDEAKVIGLPATSALPTRPAPLPGVPQLCPDGVSFYVEPGQMALTFATRFHPYQDGTSEPAASPVLVLRLSEQFAKGLALDILKYFAELETKVKAVTEAAAQAKLAQEAKTLPVEGKAAEPEPG